MPNLYLTKETSEISGVPVATLYYLVRYGKISPPPERRGRLLFWSRDQVKQAAKAAKSLRRRGKPAA